MAEDFTPPQNSPEREPSGQADQSNEDPAETAGDSDDAETVDSGAETESTESAEGEDSEASTTPEVEATAAEHRQDKTKEVNRKENFKPVANLIEKISSLSSNPEEQAKIREETTKALMELTGADQAIIEARISEAEKLFATLHIEATDGVEISATEIQTIRQIILEPVLAGHFCAETMRHLANKVMIVPDDQSQRVTEAAGYDGDMWSNGNGKISICKSALVPEKGLNLRQLITHEAVHTAIEDLTENNLETGEAIRTREELDAFSKEVLALAGQAKEKRIPQPKHVEAMLDMLANLRANYDAQDPKPLEAFEDIEAKKKKMVAKEIQTDYSAIYLQSDGSQDSFMVEALSKVSSESLMTYLKNSSDILISEEEIEQKLTAMRQAQTIEEKKALYSQFPAMTQMADLYRRAYDLAHRTMTDDKIMAGAKTRAESPDEGFSDNFDDFGYSDQSNGSSPGREQSMSDAAKGVLKAMSNELDILAPVSTPPAGF